MESWPKDQNSFLLNKVLKAIELIKVRWIVTTEIFKDKFR